MILPYNDSNYHPLTIVASKPTCLHIYLKTDELLGCWVGRAIDIGPLLNVPYTKSPTYMN
jgi:hypothetical protein